ncbi:sugar phosphate isomerase/epimerase [bacterium]|nr:sugar phosphate isomerase/epimerase [bacterium]
MIGLSTAWRSGQVKDAKKLLSRFEEIGIKKLELDYRISEETFKEMLPYLKKSFAILSIHNFFPIPNILNEGSGDAFLLSSPDEEERRRAVKHTKKTIEIAQELEAKAVVLHLGKVEMDSRAEKLFLLYGRGKISSSRGKRVIHKLKEERESKKQKYLDAVLKSLEELNKFAQERSIFLGVENRFYSHEIPDFEEIGIILEEFKGGAVRYWHDVGHAVVQENLGLLSHRELLENYSPYLVGVHLHGVRGYEDHFAPGQEEDYELIKRYIKPETIKVMEPHSEVSKKELKEGLAFLQSIGIE